MDSDLENANLIKEEIISNQLPMIENIVMPFLKKDQSVQSSEYPVIVSSLDDDINRGINFYMNGYDLYRKMETLAKFFVNLNVEDWYTICFFDENRYKDISNLDYRMIDEPKETDSLIFNSINIENECEKIMNNVGKNNIYDTYDNKYKPFKELETNDVNEKKIKSHHREEELIDDNKNNNDNYSILFS